MDKLAFAGVVAAAGLPALPRWLLERAGPGRRPRWPGPYIVKPRYGGSSIGIEVVEDWSTTADLAAQSVHLRRGAVVEPYRPTSFDLNLAVRTWPGLQLSAIERPLRRAGSAEILGYGDKYLGGEGMLSAPRGSCPAAIPGTLEQGRPGGGGRRSPARAGARGLARIDFLADGDDWWVNEINTIPGSLAKYLWVDPAPVPFLPLLTDLLAEAVRRPAYRDATGADGTALRRPA